MATKAKAKKYTRQSLFNKVSKHLLRQKRRAMAGTSCKYRTTCKGKVLRCAVGCLIPAKKYDSIIENNIPISGSTERGYKKLRSILFSVGVDHSHMQFLRDLQLIHDNSLPNEWKSELESFRIKHKLEKAA
jgi:hypothetical protein